MFKESFTRPLLVGATTGIVITGIIGLPIRGPLVWWTLCFVLFLISKPNQEKKNES